ncbi:Elongator subunit elp4 [Rhodosporidiobolus nylandii]
MSSFRRRQTVQPIPGTRPSPSGAPLLSTGLPAIDDLLGGGLPLSTILLIETDFPSSYSELLLRYWIAQGLESGQDVCVAASGGEGGPDGVVEGLMGAEEEKGASKEDKEDRDREERLKEEMKIAFRYEGMKAHQTSLPERASSAGDADNYSSVFDLTTTRQLSARDRELLHLIDVDELSESGEPAELHDALYGRIEKLVNDGGYRTSNASCILTFPSHLFASPSSSSSPLLTRLSHAAHSVLRLTSFSSSPLLAAQFPRHSGLLSFPKLPCPPGGGLVPPGAKLSVLRGLGGGAAQEGRDNLIGFRVKRKRFVVEVVSDDPVAGDEEEKKAKERRRRVEEANRKEREMAEGMGATDVLLTQVERRTATIRIGGEEHQQHEHEHGPGCSHSHALDLPPPVPILESEVTAVTAVPAPKKSAFRKKGVRMGGVGFADDGAEGQQQKASVSSMIHSRPDLLDF